MLRLHILLYFKILFADAVILRLELLTSNRAVKCSPNGANQVTVETTFSELYNIFVGPQKQ